LFTPKFGVNKRYISSLDLAWRTPCQSIHSLNCMSKCCPNHMLLLAYLLYIHSFLTRLYNDSILYMSRAYMLHFVQPIDTLPSQEGLWTNRALWLDRPTEPWEIWLLYYAVYKDEFFDELLKSISCTGTSWTKDNQSDKGQVYRYPIPSRLDL
jgi:hypothetical protein